MDKYSRENGYPCEYDNYQIPEYNPDLSPEEREERIAEILKEIDRIQQKIIEEQNKGNCTASQVINAE